MAESASPSASFIDSAPSSLRPSGRSSGAAPDAGAARDSKGHFTQAFKRAALRYAAVCGKSQRAAAIDMGISDKTLCNWVKDAQPNASGVVDVQRFDELPQLRAQNRELLARTQRLTAERDFLKKCASYFAAPTNGVTGGSR